VNISTIERTRPATLDRAPAWEVVAADSPCPVCGRSEDCAAVPAEGLARCRTVVSVRPVAGGGWLHVLVPAG
jgi:hypothetical protein